MYRLYTHTLVPWTHHRPASLGGIEAPSGGAIVLGVLALATLSAGAGAFLGWVLERRARRG
jgi:hypothetical protein